MWLNRGLNGQEIREGLSGAGLAKCAVIIVISDLMPQMRKVFQIIFQIYFLPTASSIYGTQDAVLIC